MNLNLPSTTNNDLFIFVQNSNQLTEISPEQLHQEQNRVKDSSATMHGGAAADYFRSAAYQPYTTGPTTAMFHPHQVSSAVPGSMFHHHPHPAALAAAQQQMAAAATGVVSHHSFGASTGGGHNTTYGTGGVIAPHPQRLFPAAATHHSLFSPPSHIHQHQQQQMHQQLSGKKK